ncbi:MAG: anti-sigma factor [Solirubrobacterales bacterium]|nr:anti-sigma factor [Solirubrobacterales bacterium]
MSPQAQAQLTCKEFVELVTDLIEDQLDAALRLAAEAHLGDCDGCEAYLEQIRQTVAALRGLADSGDFTRDRERALAAFRELRADAHGNGNGAGRSE